MNRIQRYWMIGLLVKEPAERWTKFWDMHSGGGTKIGNFDKIYIEAPYEDAVLLFKEMFNRDPDNVTCECCGEDYTIESFETLKEASGFHRGCQYAYDRISEEGRYMEEGESLPCGWKYSMPPLHNYMTLEEYLKLPTVLVVERSAQLAIGGSVDARQIEVPEQN